MSVNKVEIIIIRKRKEENFFTGSPVSHLRHHPHCVPPFLAGSSSIRFNANLIPSPSYLNHHCKSSSIMSQAETESNGTTEITEEIEVAPGGDGQEESALRDVLSTENEQLDFEIGSTKTDDDVGSFSEDPDLEAIKRRMQEMEEEAEKLKQMQDDLDKGGEAPGSTVLSLQEKMEIDARSVFVGNVDYSATADDLERHFHGCGSVNRVTILCDKFTGHPKGFAYIEFADKDSVETATALDDSLFKGRQIKVGPKRTNRPGVSSTNRGRGGARGRGGFRGGFGRGYGGFRPFRGRGFRRPFYSPY